MKTLLLILIAIILISKGQGKSSDIDRCPINLARDQYLKTNGDKCYEFKVNNKYHYQQAKDYCSNTGGQLLRVLDETYENFVVSSLRSLNFGDGIWLGLTDVVKEGEYRWVTGEVSTYFNWAFGQPTPLLHSIEDCVVLKMPDGKWYDYGCNLPLDNFAWVCEYSMIKETTTTVQTTVSTSQPTTTATTPDPTTIAAATSATTKGQLTTAMIKETTTTVQTTVSTSQPITTAATPDPTTIAAATSTTTMAAKASKNTDSVTGSPSTPVRPMTVMVSSKPTTAPTKPTVSSTFLKTTAPVTLGIQSSTAEVGHLTTAMIKETTSTVQTTVSTSQPTTPTTIPDHTTIAAATSTTTMAAKASKNTDSITGSPSTSMRPMTVMVSSKPTRAPTKPIVSSTLLKTIAPVTLGVQSFTAEVGHLTREERPITNAAIIG